VQRNAPRSPVRVVIWMREDACKGPVTRHRPKLSAVGRSSAEICRARRG
jgi:hypothetical protein